VLHTGDLEHDLIQMPFVASPRRAATDVVGEMLAKFARPLAHGFVADDDATGARVYAAWESGRAVGGLGAIPFQLTVPGGRVPAAGVTIAGVLPTHRRRGLLRSMMRALLDAGHARGEPVAYLWATEGTIYGRFDFGLASFIGSWVQTRKGPSRGSRRIGALIDPKIAKHRGRIVKTTGDGLLVEFASPVEAVRRAGEIQKAMREREGSLPKTNGSKFVGINQAMAMCSKVRFSFAPAANQIRTSIFPLASSLVIGQATSHSDCGRRKPRLTRLRPSSTPTRLIVRPKA
jgi:GNAT superfamily N-acetyltransferase